MGARPQPQEKPRSLRSVLEYPHHFTVRQNSLTCSGQVKVGPPDLGIVALSVPEGVLAARQGRVLCSSTFQQGYSG